MHNQIFRALTLGSLIAPSLVHAAPYDEARLLAETLSQAFEEGDAKTFRFASIEHLEHLALIERDDLEATLLGLLDTAHETGPSGLEGALLATTAALASRDFVGWLMARDALAEHTFLETDTTRPHALIPIARPGSPIVHLIPHGLIREVWRTQVETGPADLESTLAETFCSPDALEEATQRWGSELGALLASLCEGHGTGGGGYGGDLGLGFGGELSLVDCLMSHQQTRAERMQELMTACVDSVMAQGGGNPLASGSTFGWIWPLRTTTHTTQKSEPDGQGGWRVRQETHYTSNPDDGGSIVYEVTYHDDGSVETTYLNDAGYVGYNETRNADGTLRESHLNTEDGQPLRDEYRNADGTSRTVDHDEGARVETEYDADGNIITQTEYDADGNIVAVTDGRPQSGSSGSAPSSPGDEFGSTPECRELTMGLMELSVDNLLSQSGALDPRTVNPHPDAEVTPSGDLDCLGLTGGALIDASFQCREELVLCDLGQMVDASCNCRSSPTGLKPTPQCGMIMRCADGVSPTYVDGACVCESDTIPLVDPGVAPGPRPTPIDRRPR